MPLVKGKFSQGDSQPLEPNQKMQWAYFWALIGIICLIILGSLAVFLVTESPWSFALDSLNLAPGVPLMRIAMHLFPLDIRELELGAKRSSWTKKRDIATPP